MIINDPVAQHIHGSAQVEEALRIAWHCLNEASTGYLALASDTERRLHMPTAKPVFDAVSEAVSAVLRAQDALTNHEEQVWGDVNDEST